MTKNPTSTTKNIPLLTLLLTLGVVGLLIITALSPKNQKRSSVSNPSPSSRPTAVPQSTNTNPLFDPATNRTPSLQINVVGAEFLLTNSKGQRTGYDATTGREVKEIKQSSYETQLDKIPDVIEKEIVINEEAADKYNVRLTKKQAIDIKIYVTGHDANLNQSNAEVMVPYGSTIYGYKIDFTSGKVIVSPL